MVTDPRQKRGEKSPDPMKTPLIASVIFHVVLFTIVIVGLPHWKSDLDIIEAVPVELVDNIGEMTTTNKPPVTAKPKEEKKPEPPKKEEKKPDPPKKETAKPPAEDVLQPPPKEEKAEKIPEKKPEKKPEPKKPTPPKKEEKKPDPKKQEDSFESLLKDLTPDEPPQPDADETAPKMTDPTPSPNISRFSTVLSMTEMDALRYQLSQCWNIMAGAMDSESLRVEVKVVVNPDRTVRSAKILDQSKYGNDPFFRAAADSAVRALNNPKCTPLNLPPEKYDEWREMTIVFDPKEMM
ncbi:MAG: energy transducer TonB [Alphaproteobacteria bacterium]|jgi:outer membrane biosynthesis protein TonB|nr:energy transducer TonB [Alphaproteobacteria bacterium]MCB1551934.1 energy transducer TonB [Alphaproteobacteria bacterium]MCB9984682.1 energy transducer TonB [Micavibrio sp.]HPQ50829.1 energy transducer TonB [Alphaproteobacteria bacterium]HRK98013.1 energy transducer TonB [Alphaproteobacteria bacterium]